MTANPAFASSPPIVRASSYASVPSSTLADPNTVTAGPTSASASKPSTNSDRIRSARQVSVSRNAGRSGARLGEQLLVLGRPALRQPLGGLRAHRDAAAADRPRRVIGLVGPGLLSSRSCAQDATPRRADVSDPTRPSVARGPWCASEEPALTRGRSGRPAATSRSRRPRASKVPSRCPHSFVPRSVVAAFSRRRCWSSPSSPRATARSPRRQARHRRPRRRRSPPPRRRRRRRPAAPPPRRRPRVGPARRAVSQPGGRRPGPGRARGDRLRPAPRALEAPRRRQLRSLRAAPADRHPAPGHRRTRRWQRLHVGARGAGRASRSTRASTDGWVAVADHDGTPWVALADGPVAGLDVAQAAVARAPVERRRRQADGRRPQRVRPRPVQAAAGRPRCEARRQGRHHVAGEHRRRARDGPRRRARRHRDPDGSRAPGQQLERPRRPASGRSSRSSPVTTGRGRTTRAPATRCRSTSPTARSARSAGRSWTATCSASARRSAPGSGSSTTSGTPTAPAPRSTAGSARQTNDRIKQLLGPTDVTGNTRLVLVNAIYMKANWLIEFDPALTTEPHVHDVGRDVGQGPDDAHQRRGVPRARAGQRLEGDRACCTRAPASRRRLSMTLDPPGQPQVVRARPVGRAAEPDPGGARCRAQAQLQGDRRSPTAT